MEGSTANGNGAVPTDAGVSLRDRARARRAELQQEHTFVIPVPGYTDMFSARYRVIPYEGLRRIGLRNDRIQDQIERELATAADTLAHACVELLEHREGGGYVSLGLGWCAQAVREHFGVDELPEGATTRQAIREVFTGTNGDTSLIVHLGEYSEHLETLLPQVDRTMEGESGAS